jgi:probable rRNA maturation factor
LRALGVRTGAVTLALVSDAEMRRLNRVFRRQDRATDVLAFAADSGPGPAAPDLGDIAIALGFAGRQARARRWPLQTEVRRLLLHGILHLLGYDHATDDGTMKALERRLWRRLQRARRWEPGRP